MDYARPRLLSNYDDLVQHYARQYNAQPASDPDK